MYRLDGEDSVFEIIEVEGDSSSSLSTMHPTTNLDMEKDIDEVESSVENKPRRSKEEILAMFAALSQREKEMEGDDDSDKERDAEDWIKKLRGQSGDSDLVSASQSLEPIENKDSAPSLSAASTVKSQKTVRFSDHDDVKFIDRNTTSDGELHHMVEANIASHVQERLQSIIAQSSTLTLNSTATSVQTVSRFARTRQNVPSDEEHDPPINTAITDIVERKVARAEVGDIVEHDSHSDSDSDVEVAPPPPKASRLARRKDDAHPPAQIPESVTEPSQAQSEVKMHEPFEEKSQGDRIEFEQDVTLTLLGPEGTPLSANREEPEIDTWTSFEQFMDELDEDDDDFFGDEQDFE